MTAQRPLLGAALLATAMLCFSLSDAAAKQLAPQLSPTQVAWYRFALLALTVVPLALRTPALWRSRRPLLQSVRAAALVGSALLFLNGLRLMPIAEATAMVFASPLFVTLLATLLLRETMTPWRWLPVVCGFAGVLTVLRPGSFAFGGAEVFPMLSSLAWAVAVIATRRLGTDDAVGTTMLYSALIGVVGLAPFGSPFAAPAPLDAWPALLAMAAVWCGAQWLIVAAYRVAPPSAIAPFSYSQLVWSGLLGYLMFGHAPDAVSLLGIATILASGLLAMWQTRRANALARSALAPTPSTL